MTSSPAAHENPGLTLIAGELAALFRAAESGIVLQSILDWRANREFLPPNPPPLFRLALRHAATGEIQWLTADLGWQQTLIRRKQDRLRLGWSQHSHPGFGGLEISAEAIAEGADNTIRWTLEIKPPPTQWGVWRVIFPNLEILADDAATTLFVPRGPGEAVEGIAQKPFEYKQNYPDGWCTMQYMAVYDPPRNGSSARGLYVAHHDPRGSRKDITATSRPEARTVTIEFDHTPANMGVVGAEQRLAGEVVWRLFRGDWFDAALIYKNWVRREAEWIPRGERKRRPETPRWLRELPVWLRLRGDAKTCVPIVTEFARQMDMPVGFHWYNWHEIPYDNDYPHYFPAREGFAEGIRELQSHGVYVMPYINGRLWDTRDRGMEDYQFTAVARPAATKKETGELNIETYASREADGSPVELAVMCPATAVWRDTVTALTRRLFTECGVNGIYIDQIAAAAPHLCFDIAHNHPLGGGSWWNEAYWRMLDGIRAGMPAETIITSECNAEPFVRHFDAFLTWHWQYEHQVPAFQVIYAGTIQFFGRSYRAGDPTFEAALRMKAAQQLVFGEQIGWVESPDIINQPENMAFLRRMARLRRRFHPYFSEGEMARPPRPHGDIPVIKANWFWMGNEWWVSHPAVYSGAWRLPEENKAIFIFVNAHDQPIAATWHFDGRDADLAGREVLLTPHTEESDGEARSLRAPFEYPITLPAKGALVLEIIPGQ